MTVPIVDSAFLNAWVLFNVCKDRGHLSECDDPNGAAQWCLALMFCANVAPLFRGQIYADRYLIDDIAKFGQIAGIVLLAMAAALKSDLRLGQNKIFILISVPFSMYLFLNVAFSIAPEITVQYAFLFYS